MKATERLPLHGMKVLDLTQVLAGPLCTQILGDLGAEVTKIERPPYGDTTRRWGPKVEGPDRAGYFALNRNKQSLLVDLKSSEGLEVFRELVQEADVLVENFRPGVSSQLGIDYAAVEKINPAIIYASISGFGQTGPYSEFPGYDLLAQALTGLMSVTGEPEGRPVKLGLPITDIGTGLYTVIGILAAWAEKLRSGKGQHIDTSLYDTGVAISLWESVEYWSTGKVPGPLGSAHRFSAPYQALATASGYIVIAVNTPRFWSRLCEAINKPELECDERFDTNDSRMANSHELERILEETLKFEDAEWWLHRFRKYGVPAGTVRTYDQVLQDPHTIQRGLVQTIDHPIRGKSRVLATPIKLSRTPLSRFDSPPILPEHVVSLKRTEETNDHS